MIRRQNESMKKTLFVLILTSCTAPSLWAAPKSKPNSKASTPVAIWEYAFVQPNRSRKISESSYESGVHLRLKGREPIFVGFGFKADRDSGLLSFFDRLGNQGWELITTPTHNGPYQYIFKRRK